jgi:23S rRNA (uridine2552-2'-O)-methyltransferase
MISRVRNKKVNRAWLHDHLTDPYVKLANKEGFRSRAAYKLKELDEVLHLFRPGQLVVDLGAAPGAWSQYVRRKFDVTRGAGGLASKATTASRVLALDMLPMEPIDEVEFLLGDFRESAVLKDLEGRLEGRLVDVVISDMAPNLSGVADADAARMADLVELAIEFALDHLAAPGVLICKVFHGSGYSQLAARFKADFSIMKVIKPKASRGKSAETYLVGRGPKRASRCLELRA